MSEINKKIAEGQTEIIEMLKTIADSLYDAGSDKNNWSTVAEVNRLKNDLLDILEYRK